MDLNYGAEYEDFRKEVQAFCKEYQGVSFKNESNEDSLSDALSGASATKKEKKEVTRSEWQQILIEKGFIARAIPKEYGGYGGETDIIKSRIIATEFSKAKVPGGMGGQGIDMLVPTLLEWAAKNKNKNTSALLCMVR